LNLGAQIEDDIEGSSMGKEIGEKEERSKTSCMVNRRAQPHKRSL